MKEPDSGMPQEQSENVRWRVLSAEDVTRRFERIDRAFEV